MVDAEYEYDPTDEDSEYRHVDEMELTDIEAEMLVAEYLELSPIIKSTKNGEAVYCIDSNGEHSILYNPCDDWEQSMQIAKHCDMILSPKYNLVQIELDDESAIEIQSDSAQKAICLLFIEYVIYG